ncbi:hypothetical protein G7046_g7865 [Stylonectria norvegica]|nr:hypothetical protein G7046_g7865 [Stylonectria norvegica]
MSSGVAVVPDDMDTTMFAKTPGATAHCQATSAAATGIRQSLCGATPRNASNPRNHSIVVVANPQLPTSTPSLSLSIPDTAHLSRPHFAVMAVNLLALLSALFGWVYFLAWSASFYPQALLNWRRRSTSGTTVDFPFINVLGESCQQRRIAIFPPVRTSHVEPTPGRKAAALASSVCGLSMARGMIVRTTPGTTIRPLASHRVASCCIAAGTRCFAAYFVSNLAFYASPEIRYQYAARHHGLEPTVQFNDITFALHGLVLSVMTTSQYLSPSLWKFTASAGTRPSRFILGVATGCLVGVLVTYLLVAAAPVHNDPTTDWVALDVVYAVGYVKVIITLIKYTPQIVTNYRNKSTNGWSIWQILLDVTGGLLSVTQQSIDSYIQGDWSGITGNPVKFALGNISMIYDFVFIAQHYVIYRDDGKKRSGENERLLPDEERRLD